MPSSRKRPVSVAPILHLIHSRLDEALCAAAWKAVRTTERQAKWTLRLLIGFWVAVAAYAPKSLRQALSQSGETGDYEAARATPEAFFDRCQRLSWRFFRKAWELFRKSLEASIQPAFAQHLARFDKHFPRILAVDGSGLEQVRRRLKALWKDCRVPLPGSLLAIYDIRRGVLDQLDFDERPEAAEFPRAVELLDRLPRGSLLLGDRLYGVPKLFTHLLARGLYAITRRFGPVRIDQAEEHGSVTTEAGIVEDYDVLAGNTQHPQVKLRHIVLRKGKKVVLELFTNVLDRTKLSATDALELYASRWTIERLFYDLKEVLNLNRFYCGNVNAVGMQVFATAMVHTAMRITQADIAQQARIEAEAISPPKLFPKLAVLSMKIMAVRWTIMEMGRLNPQVQLKAPSMDKLPFAQVEVDGILVEPRKGIRRRSGSKGPRTEWRALPGTRKRRRGGKLT